MRIYLAIINFLLITGAVYFGVNVFYQTAASKLEIDNPRMVTGKNKPSDDRETRKPLSQYRQISERNLFKIKKVSQDEVKAETVDIAALKQTDLKLKLWGTVTGEARESYAVIEDTQQRKQTLYKVNDQIQNAIVKEIHREKIILDVDGTYEVLEMEKIVSALSKGRRSVRKQKKEPTQTNISLKRSKIDDAVNDLNTLMKQVRIRPHFKDGKPDGLTLSGIRSKSIFSEMGLRNGDIIIGVDGNTIESVDDALKLYENLQSATGVQVQIRRRGQLKTIDYKIEE